MSQNDRKAQFDRRTLLSGAGAMAMLGAVGIADAAQTAPPLSDAPFPGISSELVHTCAALVNAPARAAFDFMADPQALGRWSLGALNVKPTDKAGVFTGFSMFDGSQAWLAIDANPELLLVDYRVGTPDNLVPRIFARVVPGTVVGLRENQCYVALTAWRTASMSAERWHRLRASHEAEILLIDSQIETLQKKR